MWQKNLVKDNSNFFIVIILDWSILLLREVEVIPLAYLMGKQGK